MKVLIIDHSPIFRKLMRNCLLLLPKVDVVGMSGDATEILGLIHQLQPDLITLDIELPNFSGLDLLKKMSLEYPDIKVIIVSCVTKKDAEQTVQALELGAFDFILKPTSKERKPEKYLKELLQERVKQARSLRTMLGTNKQTQLKQPPNKKRMKKKVFLENKETSKPIRKFSPDLIAIGSSTGGPAALHQVLEALPSDFPVPILITQHMPKLFINSLADRLEKAADLICQVAKDGEPLQKGHVYISPGDTHMKVVRKGRDLFIEIEDGPRVNHAIPSVDVTYDSLVVLAPKVKTLALILTGMGNDGAKGAKALVDKGGYVIIQDEKSSVVWGMARETFALGAINEVLPLEQIHEALIFHTT